MAASAPALSAETTLDELLRRVARPAEHSISFVEVRYSRLLKAPLAVAGRLERHDDGALVREVTSPYAERTEIRAGEVVILRGSAPTRRFGLERAPELQGLLSGVTALLQGDAAALEQAFAPAMIEDGASWEVRLVPLDERVRRRLDTMQIHGLGTAARCLVMNQPGGNASVIALGASSQDSVPHADRRAMEAWCRGKDS